MPLLTAEIIAKQTPEMNASLEVVDRVVQESAASLKANDQDAKTIAYEMLRRAIPMYAEVTLTMKPTLYSGAERNRRLRLLEELGLSAYLGLESAISKATNFHNKMLSKGLWNGTENEAILSQASIYRAQLALRRIANHSNPTPSVGVSPDPWTKPDWDATALIPLFTNQWQVSSAASPFVVRFRFPIESGVLVITVHEPGQGVPEGTTPATGKTDVQYFFCRVETVADSIVLQCASTTNFDRTFSLRLASKELRQDSPRLKLTLESNCREFQRFGHWVAGESCEICPVK